MRASTNFFINLQQISLDYLQQGLSNQYISSNIYNNSLQINGTISASNINIIGPSLINIINSNFDSRLSSKTTSQLQEGSNLYYTTSRTTSDFYNNIQQISLDNLQQGSSNQYISSNTRKVKKAKSGKPRSS